MNNQGIYLSELVEQLGYKYTDNLKSWLHNILTEKENFLNFVLERESGFKVKDSASLLVENLCVIYGFKKMFGRNSKIYDSKSDFRPYQDLESGEYKQYIEQNAHIIRKKLFNERDALTNTLANLEKFFAAVQSQDTIDIMEVSLRKLMAKVKSTDGIYDFNPTELSCVIELSELRSGIAETPNNAVLYRKAAELIYEMGLLDDSLDQIDECLRLSPDDGVAWAIKAKVLLEQLEEKRSARKLRNYVSGSSPYISAMSAASIEWMFNDDVLGCELDRELRSEFVDSAFKALEFWPKEKTIFPCAKYCEDESKCPSDHLCKKPLYSTEQLDDCDITITRDWMFFHLIHNIKISEVDQYKLAYSLPELINSFRSNEDKNAFPNLKFFKDSPGHDEKVAFLYKLTLIMKKVSIQEHNALLNAFVLDFNNVKAYAENNLKTLTFSPIADALWDYLGPNEYSAMHKKLWNYVKEKENEQFEIILLQALRVISTPLEKPIMIFSQYRTKHMLQYWNEDWGPKFPDHSLEEVVCAFSKGIVDAYTCLESLDGLIDRDQLFRTDYPESLSFTYRSLVPLIALIDYNITGSLKAKETLDALTNNLNIAKLCFGKDDALLIEMFNEFWNHSSAHFDSIKPIVFFDTIRPLCK